MNISKKNIAYYVLFICLFGLLGNDLMENIKNMQDALSSHPACGNSVFLSVT